MVKDITRLWQLGGALLGFIGVKHGDKRMMRRASTPAQAIKFFF